MPILTQVTRNGRFPGIPKGMVKSALHMHAVALRSYHAHEMVRQVETAVQQFCRANQVSHVKDCSDSTLPLPDPSGYEVRVMWRRDGAGTKSEMQGNFDLHKGKASRPYDSYKCLTFWEHAVE